MKLICQTFDTIITLSLEDIAVITSEGAYENEGMSVTMKDGTIFEHINEITIEL